MIGVRKRIGAAAGVAALVFAGAVTSADAITIGGFEGDLESGSIATVTCSVAGCFGVQDADNLFDDLTAGDSLSQSASLADAFDLPNSGDATETARANLIADAFPVIGDTLTLSSKNEPSEISGCSDSSCSFTTAATLILFKAGQVTSFVKNESGGLITIAYNQLQGGPGLSHITTFGGRITNVIPIPAALPLFLTALGGLGLLGWRRRSAASA